MQCHTRELLKMATKAEELRSEVSLCCLGLDDVDETGWPLTPDGEQCYKLIGTAESALRELTRILAHMASQGK
ncbi:MAG TPA: hypothetical protein PLG21_20090 [Anaerolineae bacterium]|nr:hypothetical protein [Anaerolineae bacterium]